MPNLIAKSPLQGRMPVTAAGVTLSEVPLDRMTSVAPFAGQDKAVAKALKAAGLAMPAPNSFASAGQARIIWTGLDQAFLTGPVPAGLAACAALTDQSDGWACLRLDGAGGADVLMRLVPLDLRAQAFPPGSAARAPLNHMQSVLMRTAPDQIELLVFRSMAATAWTEIAEAMHALAARTARPR